MKGELLIAEFLSTPWALMPERIEAFAGILRRWTKGQGATQAVMVQVNTDKEVRESRRDASMRAGGGSIAVLPLYGVITQRGNMADDISGPGSVSTQRFTSALRDALADETVGAILIDIDSPGGSVYGVGELADEIYRARAQKPIVAIANSLAASAAYWIGSAASELYVTPSGEVGSIGVWMAHEDWSKNIEEAGVKVTLISAGKCDGMGQGRVLGADAALAEKMIDGIETFDDVIKRMQRNLRASNKGASRLAQAQNDLKILG